MTLFYLRRTQEVNKQYLPPKVDYVLFCKPSEMQVNLYRSLLSSRFVKRCMERNDGSNHLVFLKYTLPSINILQQNHCSKKLMVVNLLVWQLCIDALKKLCNSPVLLAKDPELGRIDEPESLSKVANDFLAEHCDAGCC